jgi:hypothetical protein
MMSKHFSSQPNSLSSGPELDGMEVVGEDAFETLIAFCG